MKKLETRYTLAISRLAIDLSDLYTRAEHLSKVDNTGYIREEGLPALQIASDAVKRSLIAHNRAKLKEIKHDRHRKI